MVTGVETGAGCPYTTYIHGVHYRQTRKQLFHHARNDTTAWAIEYQRRPTTSGVWWSHPEPWTHNVPQVSLRTSALPHHYATATTNIVYVLPLPVCPYAMRAALKPFITVSTNGLPVKWNLQPPRRTCEAAL